MDTTTRSFARLLATVLLASGCGGPPAATDAGPRDARLVDAAASDAGDAGQVDTVFMTVVGVPYTFEASEVAFYYDQATNWFELRATRETSSMVTFFDMILPPDITATTSITACTSLGKKELDWVTDPPGTQYTAGGAAGTSCAIQLTAFGPVGTIVSGTFKGVLEKSGALVSINNGTFSVHRGLDH